MSKYKYVYKIETNNLCYGRMLIEDGLTLQQARDRYFIYHNRYGCIDIIKHRVYTKEIV